MLTASLMASLTMPLMASTAAAAAPATRTPSWGAASYRVRPGHTVSPLLNPYAAWTKSELCHLTISGPGYTAHHWTVSGVQSKVSVTLAAPRRVRAGTWSMSAACAAAGQPLSARATTHIVTINPRAGRASLVGQRGPFLDFRQNTQAAAVRYSGAAIPPSPGFVNGECTYYAYEMRPDIYTQSVENGAPLGGWDAYKWASYAATYGHFHEGTVPLVGSIMVMPATSAPGSLGHVAYVTQVFDSQHFVTQEMNTFGRAVPNQVFTVYNYNGTLGSSAGRYSIRRSVRPGTVFIYGGPVISPPQYAGELNHIVQWNGDTKSQKTAWLVIDDGGQLRRRWIPTTAIYWCLRNAGSPGPDVLGSAELDAMADETGKWATCSGSSTPGGGGGGGETTYSETEGHYGVNTFSDYHSAAGEGPHVDAAEVVQVSCKVYDPTISSGNPDGYWYRLASSPWNDTYYAPANTFMNGDPWNGPYTHNTDFNVPDCAGSGAPTVETTGGITHTWTNYLNAGGTEGPSIPSYSTVQIACRLQGFAVADGNTWWYLVASSPWSDGFYASADAFYNNGATSGSLQGTPFVDANVPLCPGSGPPPPPATYVETTGGVTHTWTNFQDAGGTQGTSIAAYQSVDVTCRVQGFAVADGDTWWYEIASSPWNNGLYASADAFYNNGATSGSLKGTPFVDDNVPIC